MVWFKHFRDARRNPKLLRVERKLGEVGYARFFKLLEIISERGGRGKDFKPELNLTGSVLDLDWLGAELGIETTAVRETLDLFAAVGLIDEGAWQSMVVAVPAMLEYADDYISRCQRLSAKKNFHPSDSEEEKKEAEVVVEVEVDTKTNNVRTLSEDCTNSVRTASEQSGEAPMFDPDDRLFTPTGKRWKGLGIGKLSERFRPFIEIGNKIEPKLDETVGSWCGKVIDACQSADVEYPPQFLAITRRYREHDVPCFSTQARIQEECRRRGQV